MDKNQLILVNELDQQIGTADKLAAHLEGQRHRAYSVFLFNDRDDFLLQQRAFGKYHTPGLWSNTCCSHPYAGMELESAVLKRLDAEMGVYAPVTRVCSIPYRTEFANGLIEDEIDHVFVGRFNGSPMINPQEVYDWNYKSLAEIEIDILCSPKKYTPWFKMIYVSAYKYFKATRQVTSVEDQSQLQ